MMIEKLHSLDHCCPVNFSASILKSMDFMCKTTTLNFIDMSSTKQQSLLPSIGIEIPQGEGQDEGYIKQGLISPHPNPLPVGEGVNGTAVTRHHK